MLDVLIEGGTVIDGSGGPPRQAQVGIVGDRIVSVGGEGPSEAALRIDATGRVVAPGFVDPHSHTDWTVQANPTAESTIRQGVTTEVVGNCGMSNAPVTAGSRRLIESRLRVFGGGTVAPWQSFGEYLEDIENTKTSQNLALLVGHSTLRAAAGAATGHASEEALAAMERYTEEALDSGAIGLSTGLEYGEGRFADEHEIRRLVSIVGRYGAYYTSHIRNRDAKILDAVGEFLRVVEWSGARGQISHLNVRRDTGAPDAAWDDAVDMMASARGRGVDVQADMTPFEEGLGIMIGVLPEWLMVRGTEEIAGLLRDPQVRESAREDSDRYWRFLHKGQWDRARLVHSSAFPEFDGLSFGRIAEMRRTSEWDAFFDILASEGAGMDSLHMVGELFASSDLAEQLRHPLFSCGVDSYSSSTTPPEGAAGGTRLSFCGHIQYLSVHLRERKTVSLEEMVRKMTSMPASRFGLQGRGRIEPGYFADLVVFDAEGVSSASSFAEPAAYPKGVAEVFVNGSLVVENGRHTGARPGRVLRRAA